MGRRARSNPLSPVVKSSNTMTDLFLTFPVRSGFRKAVSLWFLKGTAPGFSRLSLLASGGSRPRTGKSRS